MADNNKDKTNGNGVLQTVEPEPPTNTIVKPNQQTESKTEATQGLGDGAAEESLRQILGIINESTGVITGIITDTTNSAISTIASAQYQAEQEIELAALEAMEKLKQVTHESTKSSHKLLQGKLAAMKLTRDSLLAKVNPVSSSNGNGKH